MLKLAELGGLNDAGQGAATATKNPGADQPPEGAEARLGEAGLEGQQEGNKGFDQQAGQCGVLLSFIYRDEREEV